MKKFYFEGILFSKVTEIFYQVKDGVLYKLPVYTIDNGKKGKSSPIRNWTKSDYSDDSGNSKNWKKASEAQCETYPQLLKTIGK